MRKLIWSELDVSVCLAAMPDVDEYETRFHYVLERDLHVVELTILPAESIVTVCVTPPGMDQPMLSLTLLVRGALLYKDEPKRDALVFQDSLVVPSRSYYRAWPDAADPAAHPFGLDLELTIQPALCVVFSPATAGPPTPAFDATPSRHVIDLF